MPRISDAEVLLNSALNDLVKDWEIARADWRDQARERFEEDFVAELSSASRGAVRSMTEVTHLLRRVVRECR